MFLGEYFCSFQKRKWKNSIFHSILSDACVGKKESNVFSWPKKKTRICRFEAFCKSCQSLEFSGESTVEISETFSFFPENKFEPINQVVLWVRNWWNLFFFSFVLQLLFISSFLGAPSLLQYPQGTWCPPDLPSKILGCSSSFFLCREGVGSAGAGLKLGRNWLTSHF